MFLGNVNLPVMMSYSVQVCRAEGVAAKQAAEAMAQASMRGAEQQFRQQLLSEATLAKSNEAVAMQGLVRNARQEQRQAEIARKEKEAADAAKKKEMLAKIPAPDQMKLDATPCEIVMLSALCSGKLHKEGTQVSTWAAGCMPLLVL